MMNKFKLKCLFGFHDYSEVWYRSKDIQFSVCVVCRLFGFYEEKITSKEWKLALNILLDTKDMFIVQGTNNRTTGVYRFPKIKVCLPNRRVLGSPVYVRHHEYSQYPIKVKSYDTK